ncbi:hypothetical protein [Kitasatospora sp. NPDC089509]|uniref:hypothetical protein n=1 Tax=Kitasatospora sp. NPDC089509 TaxID=3364079 RepID=UPI0037FF69B7
MTVIRRRHPVFTALPAGSPTTSPPASTRPSSPQTRTAAHTKRRASPTDCGSYGSSALTESAAGDRSGTSTVVVTANLAPDGAARARA